MEEVAGQQPVIISYDDLVTAVRTETRARHYDEVILATGRQEGSGLARIAGRDPGRTGQ